MEVALGPQCLTCKKRQVKCDSSLPGCRRCQVDNRTCPGYKASLKLIQYRPPVHARHKGSARTKGRLDTKAESDVPKVLHLPINDDLSVVLDTVKYYNTQVIPVLAPACMPLKRELVPDAIPWQVLPIILRHALTATLRSFQIGPNTFDPLSQPELCYHRGQALQELQVSLEDAVKDEAGVALAVIVMMMGGDMLLAPEAGCWTSHLEAARTIIRARGGFERCIDTMPRNTTLLLTFAIVNVMTTTTSGMFSTSLPTVREQQGFAHVLREHESQVMANISPCPVEVLQMLAQINMLRADGHASGHTTDVAGRSRQIAVTLSSFKVDSWAARVLRSGNAQPQRLDDIASEAAMCAMMSLAECYRAAAALYLRLSCSAYVPTDDDELMKWSRTLSTNIEELLRHASDDHDAPLESQLWKMIKWPMVISAYIKVNWKLDSATNASFGELLRLQTIALKLRSRSMLQAVEELRRSFKRHETDDRVSQTWDDGFDYRWTFIP